MGARSVVCEEVGKEVELSEAPEVVDGGLEEAESKNPDGIISFSTQDAPRGAWVWVFLMTLIWFGVYLNVSFFDEASSSRRFSFSLGSFSQVSPIWCPCDLSSGYQPVRLRVHKGLPTVVAGVFPTSVSSQRRVAPWLFGKASHIFTAPNRRADEAFMVVWVNFVEVQSKSIKGILPGEAEVARWVKSQAKFLGLECIHGSTINEVESMISAGSIERSVPVRLPPCSAEDEAMLYGQNEFEASFNIGLLRKYVSRVKDSVNAQRVVDHLDSGHFSGFVGPALDQEFLDWSVSTNDPDDLAFELETILKYAKFGYCIGPFRFRPPFPNLRNMCQPTCNKSFTIPKDSTEEPSPEMKRRFIVHGSWPLFASYNFLMPRSSTGRRCHTCGQFQSRVARYGRNTIVMMMDMVDCFMNFLLNVQEWHRQCVRVGEDYWVFRVGMFGSSCAGDFAENFTSFLTDIFREIFGLVNVCVYVDNFDNVVPPLPNGEPDWKTAWEQWRAMLTLVKMFGIRVHDFVEPSLFWGKVGDDGVAIDSHLGWGGETSCEIPRAWLSEKRREKFLRLADIWSEQEKFSCTQVRQIVGVTQSLEVVLKCLSSQLTTLYAWQTRVEERVRSGAVKSRKAKVFSNPKVARLVKGMVSLLCEREWSVPLVDWEASASAEVCCVYADAAIPKVLGLAYSEPVWGKSAFCDFRGGGFYLAQKHDEVSIRLAKRKSNLSQNYLELENYVMCIICFVKMTKAKKVHLIGDSEIAIGWISSCAPKDEHARKLVKCLINAQLDLGFVLSAEAVPRSDLCIQKVDSMSKGDSNTIQEMESNGYVRIPWKRSQ